MSFDTFFFQATGNPPFPYQRAFALSDAPADRATLEAELPGLIAAVAGEGRFASPPVTVVKFES